VSVGLNGTSQHETIYTHIPSLRLGELRTYTPDLNLLLRCLKKTHKLLPIGRTEGTR
jgi:hypothetical protein